jgi:hypothetical protein
VLRIWNNLRFHGFGTGRKGTLETELLLTYSGFCHLLWGHEEKEVRRFPDGGNMGSNCRSSCGMDNHSAATTTVKFDPRCVVQLADAVIVVLEAAGRTMTIQEIADQCEPYVEDLVSHFTVKQVCMNLFQEKKVLLQSVDPLMFKWREK